MSAASGPDAATLDGPRDGTLPLSAWLSVMLQLALAAGVVYLYSIENSGFLRVFLAAIAGFAVHALLPLAWRLPFFTLLSMGAAFLVFSSSDALWLLGSGGVLIGLANLPTSVRARAWLLVVVGVALAVSRAGFAPSPWSAAVWPILGSMFMFRLVLYVMSSKGDPPAQRSWWSLTYFFMLPNLVFPLFPVVDYQTLRRTYFDKDARGIYDLGLLWVSRGLVHLVLYRYVYHNLVSDPESVATLGDLIHFMLSTLLLYLRVSGQFHLIVGMLHLFGFRLPETHKLYYLAYSFTELWRRINIYWTDFMMKTVFYPTYFRVKHRGPVPALVISTVIVFVITWLLHSYQWFWLRGGFPLTAQDALFWTVLGGFVVYGGLSELHSARKPRRIAGQQGFNPTRGLKTALTFTAFYTLWSLWSVDSVNLWLWMLGAAATVDGRGVVLFTGIFLTAFGLGGVDWKASGRQAGWLGTQSGIRTRTVAPLLALAVLAAPPVQTGMPEVVTAAVRSTQLTGLNARDLTLQHRGYYEQLDVRAQLDTPVAADGRKLDASWQTLDQLGLLGERQDLMLRELRPSKHTTWNGQSFTTNRWGMRDQDYAKEKAPGTVRIALLGPSHVMGNNVADDDVFERLVEDRLNRELGGTGRRFEILNFGVDGYSLPQQVAILEDRVFAFSPDIVIATHYDDNPEMTEGMILKVFNQEIPVPVPAIRRILDDAGLQEAGHSGVPVPYAALRRAVRAVGVPARMPYGEARSRARRAAHDVLRTSFQRFAELTRAQGVTPLVLALNVVVDEVPAAVPMRADIEQAGVKVLDLFAVYPVTERPALRVAPWDDHPNAAGHRIIADALYEKLAALLSPGLPSPTSATSSLR